MKNNILYLAAATLLFSYTACKKISEHVQRDIIITDSVVFDLPLLSNLDDQFTKSGITSTVNIDDQINSQAKGFTKENIIATKINSLIMNLAPLNIPKPPDSIDAANNLANLSTVKVEISADGKANSIANTSVTATSPTRSFSMTTGIDGETLKAKLTNQTRFYNVIVRAKKTTTTPMKVTAKTSYTITLSK